ncbi:MAG: hypothetical protein PSY12_12760 [bacterium]|nr:hypothetical protein [bacterium]
MADIYLSADLPEGRRLSIAPITSRRLERCVDVPDDTAGYFLTEEYLSDPHGAVTILARVEGVDAALRLGQMFSMA